VPIAAPATAVFVDAWPVVVPVCCAAHCRHVASSIWNCSKFFPVPGSTMTLGPVGTVAQAVLKTATAKHPLMALIFITYLLEPNPVSVGP
jgi:hypothetical protein